MWSVQERGGCGVPGPHSSSTEALGQEWSWYVQEKRGSPVMGPTVVDGAGKTAGDARLNTARSQMP